ncbi:MAG: hypothetical protein U9Q80_05775 [Bacillota bacterium]|nr:hypothetical protein [Bacillota bacterium]
MKKMVLLLTLALLILGSFSYAIEIEEISPCPIHGLHEMHFQGAVTVYYDGEPVSGDHYLYECDCGEQMITTGLPHYSGWSIYHYWYDTEFSYGGSISGQAWYNVDSENGHYTTNSILPGYRFYQ